MGFALIRTCRVEPSVALATLDLSLQIPLPLTHLLGGQSAIRTQAEHRPLNRLADNKNPGLTRLASAYYSSGQWNPDPLYEPRNNGAVQSNLLQQRTFIYPDLPFLLLFFALMPMPRLLGHLKALTVRHR
jgi:hypothetical protein